MKLYFHPWSPNACKVLITALLLDIPLEKSPVNLLAGEQRKADFLKLNPNGLVPTLQDGDFVLWESNAIMQYLGSRRPGNTLWPAEERTRADISRWQCWELGHWGPALRIYLFENMFKKMMGQGAPDPAEIRKGEEKYCRCAGVLEGHLAGRDYLVGKGLTLADISAAAYLMYAQAARVPLDDYPQIRHWFARIQTLPAWQQTQPAMG